MSPSLAETGESILLELMAGFQPVRARVHSIAEIPDWLFVYPGEARFLGAEDSFFRPIFL